MFLIQTNKKAKVEFKAKLEVEYNQGLNFDLNLNKHLKWIGIISYCIIMQKKQQHFFSFALNLLKYLIFNVELDQKKIH
jgi:hypothetical protein